MNWDEPLTPVCKVVWQQARVCVGATFYIERAKSILLLVSEVASQYGENVSDTEQRLALLKYVYMMRTILEWWRMWI